MSNLKIFKTAIVIFVVSLLAGCSDQLTSPGSGNFESSNKTKQEAASTVEKSITKDQYFRIQIKLKPHRAYIFNVSNTNFYAINSIDVQNLSLDPNSDRYLNKCQDIIVYGSTTDDVLLNCHSTGLNLKEIVVENISSKMLDLNVTLGGLKKSGIRADLE